jgi:drug/metabolite transporter (DMT)-like permease
MRVCSAVLGTYFLKEELGTLGKLGCAICLIGSVIIVLHAPPDEEIDRIDEMLQYAIQPGMASIRLRAPAQANAGIGFLFYVALVIAFSLIMIYKVAPKYGKRNPLIYISICSTVGSLTVLSCKAFGIAVKLTFAGMNQFVYPSTYVFIIVTGVCILTQMNYFNKALSQFSSSMYIPLRPSESPRAS